MYQHSTPLLALNQHLNRLADWFPLLPFSVPVGLYRLGHPEATSPILLLGNKRRTLFKWQAVLAGLDIYVLMINTHGQTLNAAVSHKFITLNSLTAVVTPLKHRQDELNLASPSIFLPLSRVHQSLQAELEDQTSLTCHLISPQPSLAAQTKLMGQDSPANQPSPRSIPPDYALLFNLALFMSFFTLSLSFAFGAAHSWLWGLLPWLACLGQLVLPSGWLRLPALVWGILWGILLSFPLIIWQINSAAVFTALSWSGAVLLMSLWAAWRVDVIGQ